MYCARVLAFICGFLFTACGVCAQLFPLFRRGNNKANYWYKETVTGKKGAQLVTRSYWGESAVCDKAKNMWLASGALAIAGTGLGFIAMMVAFAHLFIRSKRCCCCTALITSFLAFACFIVCLAMTINMYLNDTCSGAGKWNKLKGTLDIREGYALTVAAAGGFLIMFILEFCS